MRIRTTKPEFWSHPKAARVSRDARLLFLSLLNLADDEGRLYDSPKQIAGFAFPHDDDVGIQDVHGWLTELAGARLILRYEVNGTGYVWIEGFTEHQVINRPKSSRLPHPPGMEPAANAHGTITDGSNQEGNGTEGNGFSREREAFERDFHDLWAEYPRKLARKLGLKTYQARRREGIPASELLAAVKNYARACRAAGRDQHYIKHCATFLGPNEHWRDYVHGTPDGDTPPTQNGDQPTQERVVDGERQRFMVGTGWVNVT